MLSKLEPTALIHSIPSPRRHRLGSSCLLVAIALWGIIIFSNPRPRITLTFEPIPTTPYSPPTVPTLYSTVEAGLIKKNVAVIVEDRPLESLVPLLLHFSSILGPGWPIVLFTSQDIIPSSAALRRALDERRVSITFLPPGVHVSHHRDLSNLLTKSWFWDTLAPAEKVFMFQAESIICSNAPHTLSDFLEYDFVGAPIQYLVELGGGFNGGFSLRNRTMMLDIIRSEEEKNAMEYAQSSEIPLIEFEDLWFYQRVKALPQKEDGQPAARLPTTEVAMTFAVESLWYDNPLGFHRLGQWGAEKVTAVEKWCPEQGLARKYAPPARPPTEWKDPRIPLPPTP